jgi:DNA (cytosine-5)-methyltransferase 1
MNRSDQPRAVAPAGRRRRLKVAGLFAGIGGIELGLQQAGHKALYLCENEPTALAVLSDRFPDATLLGDVHQLHQIGGGVGLLSAGFPCQDLSQAGLTAGIRGKKSGVVDEVFRLLEQRPGPEWVLLENVPFMLQLDRGAGMRYVVSRLDQLGYRWAYRVIDARAFGLPQRRERVLLLASRRHDPRPALFGEDAIEPTYASLPDAACGFYWTEGLRGLGWGLDAVPTLKGGSTIGISSPPAIWMPDGSIGTPDIRDGERLQGFPVDWTAAAAPLRRGTGFRWKLVGNAVNVRVARWIGDRLAAPRSSFVDDEAVPIMATDRLPFAAWGGVDGEIVPAHVSTWPVVTTYEHLEGFFEFPLAPLSARATAGFLGRADQKKLRFDADFLAAVRRHLRRMQRAQVAA